ncbi:MAG: YCF48-related protein [Lacunisphaera sp.]|nr:YCF48-related protein [Lacunisphaera sp.]
MLSRLISALLAASVALPLGAAESSEPAPLAARALLLDVVRAGDKLVAVGDRGHIVLSADGGRTWTQSLAPTRAMLTGVAFPDAQHGWAVGHDGVILATADGGQIWSRQDDGQGLDTVWLDVLFRDARHGFVVGAYGKFLVTADGGQSWTAVRPSPDEVHFNRITAGPDGYLYLAGESGTVLASHDGGATWLKAEVPYDGSLFGILPLDGGCIIAYGLRGHILRSDDHGTNWAQLNSEVKVLIMGGTRLQNGVIVLGGQGGNFFLSRDAGKTFTHWKPADFGTSVADLIEAGNNAIIAVGEAGAVRLELPKP